MGKVTVLRWRRESLRTGEELSEKNPRWAGLAAARSWVSGLRQGTKRGAMRSKGGADAVKMPQDRVLTFQNVHTSW